MDQKILDVVREASIEDLGPLLEILVNRLYEHRRENPKGHIPSAIFEYCIGIAGMSVSVQIVNEVVDGNGKHVGFALRQRDSHEVGGQWEGMYHSTCTTGLLPDTPEAMLARNTRETFGGIPEQDTVEFLGVTIHDEPERWSSCLTVMHLRKVTAEQVAGFDGNWKVFTDVNDPNIIDHNRYLLQWVADPHRVQFADIRGGWKRN